MRPFLVPTLAATALLAACGSVYDKSLPDIEDDAAINSVISDVEGQDKILLRSYFFRKNNVRLGLIEAGPKEWNSAKTVRQAIEEQKLVRKHMDEQVKLAAAQAEQARINADRLADEIERQMAELAK